MQKNEAVWKFAQPHFTKTKTTLMLWFRDAVLTASPGPLCCYRRIFVTFDPRRQM